MAGYSPAGAGAIPFVEAKLKQRKVMLFTKKRSRECDEVHGILDKYGMSGEVYEKTEIDSRQDATQIENYFQTVCQTNNRCVPRLFIARKYVGSTKEIKELDECGKLKRMLVVVRALDHL